MGPLIVVVVVTALLTFAGCGQRQAKPSAFEDCGGLSVLLVHADLDADGDAEGVRLTGSGAGACAGSLTAEVDGTVVGISVRTLDLVAQQAIVVPLTAKRDVVLVRSRTSSTGQWQPHLFGLDGGSLSELTDGGRPVLPAVHTSRGSAPMDATCTPSGGIAVLTAKAHQPPGIILAWDVTRTAYDVRGDRAVRTGNPMVKEAAADPLLRKEMPGLYDGRLFADC